MKKLLIIFSLSILASSCANQIYTTSKSISYAPNKELWIGKTEEKLALHPIFATMPVETRKTPQGIETRRYTEGGVITSSGNCSGKDCAGVNNQYACNHVFYLKNGIVNNYHRVGSYCGPERLELRPLNDEGVAEYTKFEIDQGRELASAQNEPKSCNKTSECSDGMSCSGGVCKSLGLWGKIFNP